MNIINGDCLEELKNLEDNSVDAVAISLHRHREARRKGPWPNMWTKYADLDEESRNEYRARAGEIITAVQGTATLDKAVDALAALWRNPGPAKARYTAYARERLTETLSDVPTLKETK